MLRPGKNKAIKLPPVRPNAGIEAAYRKALTRLVDEMHKSLLYWLSAAYRANAPEMASDESPAKALQAAMKKLADRWQRNFDRAAPALGKYFATSMAERTDGALASILKKNGMTVQFKMTPEANDVMQASIGEQVGLIKSIASEHLTDIEGLVMRSVSAGRDLATLSKDIEAAYGVTKRRAALIARDQNNKATAAMTRVRQEGLGITEAVWMHSHGGKHPRKSHLAADGKTYKIKEGMYLDGKWVWPGTEINCRCVSRSIIPGL